jgi:uncharacterized hydrophobic protein (TIGR00271 family)
MLSPVLHVRVACPSRLTDEAVGALRGTKGVAAIGIARGASLVPPGDVLECEVVREASNDVFTALLAIDTERELVVSIVEVEAVANRAVRHVEGAVPGFEADALPWPLIEADARVASEPSATFFVLMALAAVIAAIGIAVDSAVLIIGAMIVGPEYGPITAVAVGIHRRQRFWRVAAATLVSGLVLAVLAAAAFALLAELLGESQEVFEPSGRFFTAFVTDPNAYSAVVAFVAGVAGTIALARSQATVVAGVLVSVTTIPAAAAIGVGLATEHRGDAADGAIQLGINVAAILVAILVTLSVYDRVWRSISRR